MNLQNYIYKINNSNPLNLIKIIFINFKFFFIHLIVLIKQLSENKIQKEKEEVSK